MKKVDADIKRIGVIKKMLHIKDIFIAIFLFLAFSQQSQASSSWFESNPAAKSGSPEAASLESEVPRVKLLSRSTINLVGINGLSGLALDDSRNFWAVAERHRSLVRLSSIGDKISVSGMPVVLNGIPDGVDTESLAFLGKNRFAVGCESQALGRTSDPIFILDLSATSAKVISRIDLSYDLWGLKAEANHGIEGLCAAGDFLIAAVETVGRSYGHRWAPLGVLNMKTNVWAAKRLRLASQTGKISSLDCQIKTGGKLSVWAIERHYKVVNLLHFEFDPHVVKGEIIPETVADLGQVLGRTPNIEGVVIMSNKRLALLVDNQTGVVSGPNEIIVVGYDD